MEMQNGIDTSGIDAGLDLKKGNPVSQSVGRASQNGSPANPVGDRRERPDNRTGTETDNKTGTVTTGQTYLSSDDVQKSTDMRLEYKAQMSSSYGEDKNGCRAARECSVITEDVKDTGKINADCIAPEDLCSTLSCSVDTNVDRSSLTSSTVPGVDDDNKSHQVTLQTVSGVCRVLTVQQAVQLVTSAVAQLTVHSFRSEFAVEEALKSQPKLQESQPAQVLDIEQLPEAASSPAEIIAILTHNLLPNDAAALFNRHCEKFDDFKYFVELEELTVDGQKNPEYVRKVVENVVAKKCIPIKDLMADLRAIGRDEISVNLNYNNALMTAAEALQLMQKHSKYMMKKADEQLTDPPRAMFYIFLHLMLALLDSNSSKYNGAVAMAGQTGVYVHQWTFNYGRWVYFCIPSTDIHTFLALCSTTIGQTGEASICVLIINSCFHNGLVHDSTYPSECKGAVVFTRYLTDLRKGIGFNFDSSKWKECKGAVVFTRYLTDLRKGIGFNFDSSKWKEKVASLDYLFVPILVPLTEEFHYILIVFFLTKKEVWFLDSTGRALALRDECITLATKVLKSMWPECGQFKMGVPIATKVQTEEKRCGIYVYQSVKSLLKDNLYDMEEFDVNEVAQSIWDIVMNICCSS